MLIFEIAVQIKFWGPMILFSIGVPAACINAFLFVTIKSLHQSSSAYYVVGQSFADISVLLIILLQIVPSTSVLVSSVSFKLMVFFVQMTVSAAMSFLCLSAFDRWACTSQNVRIRQMSTIRVTRFIFPIPFVVWSLVNIPFLIYCDVIPPLYTCWFTNDVFMKLGTLFLSPILTVFLPLTILILFGLLTWRNIRFVTHIRQHPYQTHLSTWDQQMTRMMLTQTFLSIFCTIPRAVFVIYSIAAIDSRANLTFDQLSIISLVDYLSLSLSIISINFSSSFYIFLLLSPRFRRTIRTYLTCLFNLRHNQIDPMNVFTTGPSRIGRQTTRRTTTHRIIQS